MEAVTTVTVGHCQIAVHPMPIPSKQLGTPAVFLHGGGFHARVWESVARRMQRASPSSVALDLPGHGQSGVPPDGDFRWARFGRIVVGAVEQLGLHRPVLVAHSMGAAIGILGAIEHPGAFAAIWAYEPMVPPTGVAELTETARPARPVEPSREAVYARYSTRPPMNRLDPETLWTYIEDAFVDRDDGTVELRCGPDRLRALGLGWSDHDAFARLHELTCPVVIAHGAADHYQAEWAARIVARLPDGRAEAFPHLSHLGPLEDPMAMAASIDSFLSSLDRVPGPGQ